jgi:uncharacterized protein
MSVEVRPLGVECNLACQYCYQNPERDLGQKPRPYDIEKMIATLAREGQPFALFGGEPLLVPLADLEKLWAFGLERFGHNRLQTNGALIEPGHIDAFLRYRVRVGMSIDGPGELNDARWAGSVDRTRAQTEASITAMRRLCEAGVPTSLILTLHQLNASPERLPRLVEWVRELDALGLRGARLHLLEVDDPAIRERHALSIRDNLAALEAFSAIEPALRMKLDLFGDMRAALLGEDEQAPCVWRACDPYTTAAVRSVEGRGELSNCGRTNKEGVGFGKADQPAHVRSLILYHTPQEHGGCKGCRFFLACKGHCPGTAINGDWRNRSEHCEVYLALFAKLERELHEDGRVPLSQHPRRSELEHRLAAAWSRQNNPTLQRLVRELARDGST